MHPEFCGAAGERRDSVADAIILIPQYDLVTEFGRRGGRNTVLKIIREFKFTGWVIVHLGNFLRHFSVRFVLTSAYSVFNSGFSDEWQAASLPRDLTRNSAPKPSNQNS